MHCLMRHAITPEREERLRQVLARRQKDLTLVLDNIHDPHNVAAVLRSCDAFGVAEVFLHYTYEAFPPLSRRSSGSARKWVEVNRYDRAVELCGELKTRGYHIIAAEAGGGAKPLPDWDLTGPTAIILGNEHRGMEPAMAEFVDDRLYIPMMGMVQSLNVSVAAAVILYEAWRQRREKGMFDRPAFSPEELEEMLGQWRTR